MGKKKAAEPFMGSPDVGSTESSVEVTLDQRLEAQREAAGMVDKARDVFAKADSKFKEAKADLNAAEKHLEAQVRFTNMITTANGEVKPKPRGRKKASRRPPRK